ncbi:hypothetical protein OKW21_000928 [Catalinimonas alkaloidigena]|nr:hypothetical protein [Catalinimonas alkaloidigena]
MRVSFKGLAKLSLALLVPVTFMFSSCSEDAVDPSAMPPKDQIKTPPRKE